MSRRSMRITLHTDNNEKVELADDHDQIRVWTEDESGDKTAVNLKPHEAEELAALLLRFAKFMVSPQ